MIALRLAATVVHALPGVRVRLRDGDRTLLHVATAADEVLSELAEAAP